MTTEDPPAGASGAPGDGGSTMGGGRVPFPLPTEVCAETTLDGNISASLAFTENGAELVAGQSYSRAKVLSVPGLDELATLSGYGVVAVSRQGVVAMGADATPGRDVLLEDLRGHRASRTLPADSVFSLSFSSDGETLAVGSNAYIAVYRTTDGLLLERYDGFINGLTVALSPDARYISGRDAYQGILNYWDRIGGSHQSLPSFRTPVFTPDGRWLATFGDRTLELRVVESFAEERRLESNTMQRVAFSRDSDIMMSAGATIEYRQLSTFELLGVAESPDPSIATIAISPDGHFAASGTEFGVITLYCAPAP
jgi:WD40 repeat protein